VTQGSINAIRESSLEVCVDLNWICDHGGRFGNWPMDLPVNTGVVVGKGGTPKRMHINMNFRSKWRAPALAMEDGQANGRPAPVPIPTRLTTCAGAGRGSLHAGFEAEGLWDNRVSSSNADSPSRFLMCAARRVWRHRADGACITDAQEELVVDSRKWQQQTIDSQEPGLLTIHNGSASQRAWVAGTSALRRPHYRNHRDNITLGTLRLNSPRLQLHSTGFGLRSPGPRNRERRVINIRRVTGKPILSPQSHLFC